jgi:PQQ-like domain
VVLSAEFDQGARSDAERCRRRHVCHYRVEHRPRHQREDRRKMWTFDSNTPHGEGYKLCCDVVNRGVAVYKGKVHFGTTDGRLIALDAASGKMIWSIDASPDGSRPYTITGAPLVAKGKVFHRLRGRRIRRSRRRELFRRGNRRPGVALVHGAGRSFEAV